ncbi:MAG: zinc ribbon domain-containing protein, partial [Clostridia bacterium]|nr:zinc ribbon domain-containing protein [Clostridia bacterium]
MRTQYPCPSCFVNLSDAQKVCPNCGKPNPHYDSTAKQQAASQSPKRTFGLHHPSATIGACEFCGSELYSDEKECSHCGAPNPNFVVHPESDGTVSRGGTRAHGSENASTGRCPYCDATVRSNERYCANCGSENPHFVEDTVRVILHPRTIEELKEYCAERDMPLLRMRFFIGEDYRGPKAFGIYKDGAGKVIVYKNKADGSR